MHSVRRAAFRAASSSSSLVTVVSKRQLASFAQQFSKAGVRQAAAIPAARYFSQTSRFAQEEKAEAEAPAEEPASSETAEKERGHNVFISNMTFDATDMHLREAFSKYGDIISVNIGRDGRGLSRGFTTREAAERAVEECDKSFWHGRRLSVQHGKSETTGPRESSGPRGLNQEPTTSLYIGNIPYETSDADLNRLFRTLDNIVDVRVAVDRNTGWPRGFAHADFADIESAKQAYEKIGQTMLGGRQLRVDYSEKKSAFTRR